MKPLFAQLTGLEALVGARLGGLAVHPQPIPGDVDVVQLSIEGRDELPIFITGSPGQILCICYLWDEDEVMAAERITMMEAMLDLNPAIPLSSFGRIGTRYVLASTLPRDARTSDIAECIVSLSDNALDALQAMDGYLK